MSRDYGIDPGPSALPAGNVNNVAGYKYASNNDQTEDVAGV